MAQRWIAMAMGLLVLTCSLPLLALDPQRAPTEYVVDHWGFPAGLPQVSVTSIALDGNGFLWMSTQGGLARFDGLNFRGYGEQQIRGYRPAIGDRVWRDNSDRLWLGSSQGAAILDGDRLVAVEGLGAEVGHVHAFAVAPGGSVLLGTDHGVYAYAKGRASRLGLADSRVYALHSDGSRVYAGSDGAVYLIDAGMASLVESADDLSSLRFRQIASRAGRIYLGSSRGLFEISDGELRRPDWAEQISDQAIEALYGDSDGNLWIGLIDGLMRHSAQRPLEWVFSERDNVRPWVASIFEDPRGDLWVGSYTTGLSRWWNGWATTIGPERGLADPFVWSVARGPDDRVLVGSATGLWQVNEQGSVEAVVSTQTLRNSAVYNLFVSSAEQIWIGTRAGMARLHEGKLDEPSLWAPLATRQINAVLETAQEHYWIGTSDGLYLQSNGVLKRYGPAEGLEVAAVRSLAIFEDQLYVGSERGLYIGTEGQFRAANSGNRLDQAMITSMVPLSNGKLAIGTYRDGIHVRSATGYSELTTREGLPWNSVGNLQVDSEHLWVSGPNGVFRSTIRDIEAYVLDGGQIRTEPVLNEGRNARGGQRLRCCNAGALSRGLYANGYLWFPSLNGLVRISPNEVLPPEQPATVLIERISADGGQRWNADQRVELPLGVRDISIEYTAIAFRDPESIRFRYRLAGYESDWQSPSAQRSVRYTNLPPGSYRFELQAQGGAHDLSVTAEAVELAIPANTGESTAFRALLALAAATLIAVLGYVFSRRSAGRELQLQQQVEQRTAELRRANDRLRNANQALAEESLTDGLTGLKNRRFLARFLADWRRRSLLGETAQEQLWLFLVDLDHFKSVNDRYGHLVGDDILKQFSQLLLRLAGDGGHALRWGGEEFLLLMPEAGFSSVEKMAERIVKAVRRADFRANEVERVPLSVSLGVCPYPALPDRGDIADWALALELADAALYWVKRHGRNGWNRLIPSPQAHHDEFIAEFRHGANQLVQRGLASWQRDPG